VRNVLEAVRRAIENAKSILGREPSARVGVLIILLIAPTNSRASLAFMLYALNNGDEKLAKAHALYGAVNAGGKLLTRLFLEAYRACCDLKNEGFRRAVAKLFFYHV